MKQLYVLSLVCSVLSQSIGKAQSLGNALNTDLDWTTGGEAPWQVTINAHDGAAAAQSGIVAPGAESWVSTTVTGPAAVNFWWRASVSTALGYLQLYVGTNLQAQITGYQTNWEHRSFYVPPGLQLVKWTYQQAYPTIRDRWGFLDEVTVSSALPPILDITPTNQSVFVGDTAVVAAQFSGTEPLRFQWLKDQTPIAGATNSSLILPNCQVTATGDYSLILSNPLTAVTSGVSRLSVVPGPPVFTLQPLSQGAPPWALATLRAEAKGVSPFSWQWYRNGESMPGQSSSQLFFNGVQSNSYADYYVVVANSLGTATSTVAKLDYAPVAAWGDNTYGQNNVPLSASNIVDLCGGDYHCVGLREDGVVVGWGTNFWSEQRYDQAIVPPEATNAVSIAAGTAHGLAARADGSVVKWGQIVFTDWQDVPPDATNIIQVAQGPGAQHALALRQDGTILEWGSEYHSLIPAPADLTNIISVAAGSYHSLVLRANGQPVSWGYEPVFENPQIVPPQATNIVAIAAGWYHNLGLRADGKVIGWGTGPSQTNVPASATNIVAIACGAKNCLALRRDGTILGWGSSPSPAVPVWVTNVVAIAATRTGNLAILGNGPPHISTPLTDRFITTGENAVFYIKAVGAFPLSYQWQFNGSDIPGATDPWLLIPSAQISASGSYCVVVSNALGRVTSQTAALHVTSDLRLQLACRIGSNSQVILSGVGQPGTLWMLEAGTNLINWSDVGTITNATGTFQYTEPSTGMTRRFYRLRWMP